MPLFGHPRSYQVRDVGEHAVHDEIQGGKNEKGRVPYTGHRSSAESKRRRPLCSHLETVIALEHYVAWQVRLCCSCRLSVTVRKELRRAGLDLKNYWLIEVIYDRLQPPPTLS